MCNVSPIEMCFYRPTTCENVRSHDRSINLQTNIVIFYLFINAYVCISKKRIHVYIKVIYIWSSWFYHISVATRNTYVQANELFEVIYSVFVLYIHKFLMCKCHNRCASL